ncbi:MAG: DUF1566 domain-containing protein [Bacteroidaceae bacterium]|nr:DUF1566 domain-containing protein [Bacteroidaceae bacterium]
MKELKYLQRLFLLLAVGFSLSFACVACGDDEDDEPFDGPNTEQNDNGGGGSQNGGTAPTDSIMPPAEEPVLPNDSTSGGEDSPIVSDSIKNEYHEAVDLGLSVKWATCNVSASSPEEYGDYFAWGETKPKSSYYSDNSTTYSLSTSELQSRGIIGSDGNLTAAYDAATANWGGSWRMPTLDEMKELLNNCTWTWTTQNGVKGYKVTGPNGNSIFLPAAGYRDGTDLNGVGSYGGYWSATPDSNSGSAFALYFLSGYFGWNYIGPKHGRAVRPVSE